MMKRITLTLQSPYIGLRPFSEREAVLFFGREQHVRDLLDKLEGQERFIAVLGASGSGKSSLVRAGLVPALHRGALTSAGHSWNVCIFTPGDAPLSNLAQALTEQPTWPDSDNHADAVASLSAALGRSPLALTGLYRQKPAAFGGQALLLVVDQFEEIFRYRQRNIDEAESFINLLLRSSSEDVPIYVVLTMRSDFLGKLVAFFGLPEAVNRGIYLTPRLGPDQLKSIIASPLGLIGGEIDSVLVSRLVNTLEGEDELPIMEHALLRMRNRAQAAGRSSIQVEDFEAVCAPHDRSESSDGASPILSGQAKLSYAIDNHASDIYDALSSQQQRLARRVFLALVERREGGYVRRPRALKQLIEEVGEQELENVEAVIDAFRAEQVGFLRPSMSTPLADDRVIDISHECLFRQWHLFQHWLSEEATDAAELKDWQDRTARHKEGGGWLDEYDCERAIRWRVRVLDRPIPSVWAQRYGGSVAYAKVDEYIEGSIQRVNQIKTARKWKKRRVAIAVLGPAALILGSYFTHQYISLQTTFRSLQTTYGNLQTIRTTPTRAEKFEEFKHDGLCPFNGEYKKEQEQCEVMVIEPPIQAPKFHRTEGQLFYNKEGDKCPYPPQFFAQIREDGIRCIIEAPNNITLYHTSNTVYYLPFPKSEGKIIEHRGVDLYGDDYRDFPIKGQGSEKICGKECELDKNCKAFSFSSKANRCWLKHKIPNDRLPEADIVSGEKLQSQASPETRP